jgi:hypothetical protein
MFYNFTRKQAALKMTGVTDRAWEITDALELIEAWEARNK